MNIYNLQDKQQDSMALLMGCYVCIRSGAGTFVPCRYFPFDFPGKLELLIDPYLESGKHLAFGRCRVSGRRAGLKAGLIRVGFNAIKF